MLIKITVFLTTRPRCQENRVCSETKKKRKFFTPFKSRLVSECKLKKVLQDEAKNLKKFGDDKFLKGGLNSLRLLLLLRSWYFV